MGIVDWLAGHLGIMPARGTNHQYGAAVLASGTRVVFVDLPDGITAQYVRLPAENEDSHRLRVECRPDQVRELAIRLMGAATALREKSP